MWIYVVYNYWIYTYLSRGTHQNFCFGTSEPLRPWSGTPDPYLGLTVCWRGYKRLPKRHPPKVNYRQVLVVFTCLIVDTWEAPLTGYPHTASSIFPPLGTSPTKPWCAKLHCFHLPVNLLDLTTVFLQPNLLIYGPDQILVRWRYSEKGIPFFFFKGLHVGVMHLKTFLSIAADFQVFLRQTWQFS